MTSHSAVVRNRWGGDPGPEVHVHQSGCADVPVPDDEVALACICREIAKLPSSGADFYRHGREAVEPLHRRPSSPG